MHRWAPLMVCLAACGGDYYPGQPASFLSHSYVVAPDSTVLTTGQTGPRFST